MKNWQGTQPENVMRRRLQNGDIVTAYGGAFMARRLAMGGVKECDASRTWETKYRTIDGYLDSLRVSV